MGRKRKQKQGKASVQPVAASHGAPKPQRLWQIPLAMAVVGAIVFTLVYVFQKPSGPVTVAAKVRVPELSVVAQAGQVVFENHCVECHGPNAAGSNLGPPLIHKVYEPSHHADIAIRLAISRGVQAHHWNFGNMPRVGLSDEQTQRVIRYIREVQRANGIG